jgi:hypothetical protein
VGICGCVRAGFSPDDMSAPDHGPADDATPPVVDRAIGERQVTTGDSAVRDGAHPSPDSAPPTCASRPNGSPCDVADSKNEYGQVEGAKGWWYGFWNAEDDPDGTYDYKVDFTNMVVFGNNTEWRPPDDRTNPSWCYLDAWWEHPSASPRRLPVRRWISDVSGPALIQPQFNMADTGGGDGTKKTVLVDGVEIWSQIAGGTDKKVYTAQLQVKLAVGTVVDFVLDPLAGQAQDTSNFEVTIVSP